MNSSDKSKAHRPSYEQNPFANKLIKSLYYGSATRPSFSNGTITVEQKKVVDSKQFVKLYVNGLFQLDTITKPGERVLRYVLLILRANQDKVVIITKEVQEHYKLKSPVSIYNGINNLIDLNLIARHSTNVYWINPKFLYNGDRLKLVNSYERQRKNANPTNSSGGHHDAEKRYR